MVEIIFFSALWKRQTERQCKEWNVWSGRQPNYPNLARATEKNCTWWIRQIPLYTFDFVKPVCRLKWFIFWVETVLMSPAIYVYLSISYAPKYINYRDLCYRNGLSACEMGKFVAERARTHTQENGTDWGRVWVWVGSRVRCARTQCTCTSKLFSTFKQLTRW